jgi:hypothetical protein
MDDATLGRSRRDPAINFKDFSRWVRFLQVQMPHNRFLSYSRPLYALRREIFMTAGTLTLACLLLVAGSPPSDVVCLNKRNLAIPIDLDPAQRAQIQQLILYVSSDQGRNWHQEAVVPPDKDSFLFYPPNDGSYWFKVAVVDRQGTHQPENVFQGPVHQKVLIDTLKPLVRIVSAERQGEEIAVRWEIQEENPDLDTLKLEYQTKESSQAWTSVPVTAGLSGQARIRPGNPDAVSIRLSVQDLCHNSGTAQTDLPAVTGIAAAAYTPAPSGPSVSKWEVEKRPVPPTRTEKQLPSPPESSDSGAKNTQAPPGALPTHTGPSTRLVASTQNPAKVSPPEPGHSEPRPSKTPALPKIRIVKDREVTLDFSLAKVGPSGVGSVELYLTRDDGQTWKRYADIPEPVVPMPGGHCQRTLQLPGEGVFGLFLVVKSRAGLGKPPPREGTPPQIRIEVDTTAPVAQLFAPIPDPDRRDAILITWNASDRNLAPAPITLEWSQELKGPWQTIAADLPNSGKHSWQLPPTMPDRVFLRLRVRDTAGNEGIAVTNEPQLVDLSEPEVEQLNLVTPVQK